MTTTSTTSVASTQQPQGTTGTTFGSALGKDDFLKLLTAQLKYQDPMNPQNDPSQFASQMAQYTTLEQITNLATSMDKLSQDLDVQGAVGLIGRQVTYTTAQGGTASGTVTDVAVGGGAPTLTIGGTAGIDPSAVTEVS